MNEIKEEQKNIDREKLVCSKSNEKINTFKPSFRFPSSIYDGKITLEEAKRNQYKMLKQLKVLEKYNPKSSDKTNSRKETLINAEELYNNRKKVNKAENGVFPFNDGFQKKESDASDKALPDWVNVEKKRFDRIKNQIQNAKKNNL